VVAVVVAGGDLAELAVRQVAVSAVLVSWAAVSWSVVSRARGPIWRRAIGVAGQ